MLVHFDIETIPGQRPGIREEIAAAMTHPGNMSKPETIAAWEKEQKPGLVEAAYARAGLNGSTGEVWCIAWAFDDGPVECSSRVDLNAGSEKGVLTDFYTAIPPGRHCFVGHFISGFDLRFLWQRSVVCGVKPPRYIPFDAKPWGEEIFDTMVKWAGKGSISQDNLCKVLGLPVKDGMDGSQVWGLVQKGEFTTVAEYCRGDVQRVREIYKRMQFL